MEIDRKTIKALSADTRLNILKLLRERKKLPSELSKDLKLAPSTVVEHLKKLEESQLIQREERGNKWVYYNLTQKGRNLTEPKTPMQFVLVLSLSLIMIIGGFYSMSYPVYSQETSMAGAVAEKALSAPIITAPLIDWSIIIIIIGIILAAFSIYKLRR